uniref:Uncharacterized protein n=1 Tax=Romanomermis culicivorax TaxID=13658 RepID=A0A915K0N7_ROMCU
MINRQLNSSMMTSPFIFHASAFAHASIFNQSECSRSARAKGHL